MGNSKKKKVRLATVMGSRPFQRGFNEVRRGEPFDPNAFAGEFVRALFAQPIYERGRQFAVCCPQVDRLKEGRHVTEQALSAYVHTFGRTWRAA